MTQIDPKAVAKEMRPEFDRISKEIMDEIMAIQAPEAWEKIPDSLKENYLHENIKRYAWDCNRNND